MARKKVRLAWIANDSARRATFKKRSKGLMKKVAELSVLCGVEACAIVYDGQQGQQQQQQKSRSPDVWPSSASAIKVLSKFRSMPPTEQGKKMMDQLGFLRHRNTRVREHLRRLAEDNNHLHSVILISHALSHPSPAQLLAVVGIDDLKMLACAVETKLEALNGRMDNIKRKQVLLHNREYGKNSKDQDRLVMTEDSYNNTSSNAPGDHQMNVNASAATIAASCNASMKIASADKVIDVDGSTNVAGAPCDDMNMNGCSSWATSLTAEEQQLLFGSSSDEMMMMSTMLHPTLAEMENSNNNYAYYDPFFPLN